MDTRASMLGARYSAMIQRCYTDTHVSSHNYKGRGIRVLFNRREFIEWALAKWPEETFLNMDFDREDNDGHYCFENLRLVSRVRNLRNTRASKDSLWQQTEAFMQLHPDFDMKPRHVWNLLQKKKTWEEIETQAVASRKLTKKARRAKIDKLEAKAAKLVQENPGIVLGEEMVAKLLRQDVSSEEILRVNAWKIGMQPLESLPSAIQIMVVYPVLTYSRNYLNELLREGLTGQMIVARREAQQLTPRAVAMRFVENYPGTYSLDTAYRKLKAGLTWDQLVESASEKFPSRMPTA